MLLCKCVVTPPLVLSVTRGVVWSGPCHVSCEHLWTRVQVYLQLSALFYSDAPQSVLHLLCVINVQFITICINVVFGRNLSKVVATCSWACSQSEETPCSPSWVIWDYLPESSHSSDARLEVKIKKPARISDALALYNRLRLDYIVNTQLHNVFMCSFVYYPLHRIYTL